MGILLIPSDKRLQNNYGESLCFTGKTIDFDWAIFNSYVELPEGTCLLDIVDEFRLISFIYM